MDFQEAKDELEATSLGLNRKDIVKRLITDVVAYFYTKKARR
ncbi:hypothetical protein [Loigolactobacillus bifermentans]|nr:hypothetical protein [Loigolactobacillus bifermentans]